MMSKPIISFRDVSFTYPTRSEPSLHGLTFDIHESDFVLVTGATGCGKSTLLKMLNGIIPCLSKGTLSGTTVVAGRDSGTADIKEMTREVGLIFQNPDDQIVSNSVEEEIAFGLENLGLDYSEIKERIAWACKQVSIGHLRERDPNTLSGGQKQRLVIASQIAMRPKILAFDEPLSSLDPQGASEVMECISGLNRQGITIVLVEHRIAFAAPHCSQVMILDHGRCVEFSSRDNAFLQSYATFRTFGLKIPDEVHICKHTGKTALTFDTNELTEHIREWDAGLPRLRDDMEPGTAVLPARKKQPAINIENMTFGYRKSEPILSDFSLKIHTGETVALMGANGTGKSTILSLIAGLVKPDRGRITVGGVNNGSMNIRKRATLLGFLIQNPDLMLFCDTVYNECAFGPIHIKRKRADYDHSITTTIEMLNLISQKNQPPFALSMGQRLRVALSAVLSLQPRILLLDEPTTGQNEENIRQLMNTIESLDHVETIVFCTHDFNRAIEHADRIIVLGKEGVVADGRPSDILYEDEALQKAGIQPPLATRLARVLDLPPDMSLPHRFHKMLADKAPIQAVEV